jgi:hypothetical protein
VRERERERERGRGRKNKELEEYFGYSTELSIPVILVNNQLDAQYLFMYVYFYSLHVSGSHVTHQQEN